MARTYQTNVALEELRGKLATNRVLEYAENNNPAFEAPAGRQYARNYKACIVLCKRASSGKTYFQVKTKSATLINAGTKHQMALFGGAGAILAGIAHNAVLRARCEATYDLARKAGQTSARTYRKFMTDILVAQLADKNPIISLAVSDGEESSSFAIQNPWCYTGQQGGIHVDVSNAVLVKFWSEMASNPVIFYVDGRKGVAHAGDDFEAILSPNRYNVLNLTQTELGYVKKGDSWLISGETYVVLAMQPTNGQKFTLTDEIPEP